MKIIRLTDTQANVLFHLLNNYSAGWDAAKDRAWMMDRVDPQHFGAEYGRILTKVTNAEDEVDPRML